MAKLLDLRKTETSNDTESTNPADSIAWRGPLAYHQPDTRAVWLAAVALWVVALVVQVFDQNIITTVFFSLLGVMLIVHAKRPPAVDSITLSGQGVQLGERTYQLAEIKSFWLDYQPTYDIKELSLQLKKWYSPYIKIPITDQNPVQIRSFLIQFIPEVEHPESLTDTIARRLGL